jgi:hypothetical protein
MMYFYVIKYVMRFYGISVSASLNDGPLPLHFGPLTFGVVRACYTLNSKGAFILP